MSRNDSDVPPVPENDGDRSWMDDPEYKSFLEDSNRKNQQSIERVDKGLAIASAIFAFLFLILAAKAGFDGRPFAVFGHLVLFAILVGATLVFSGGVDHLVRDASAKSDQEIADEEAHKAGRAPSWHPDNL